MIKPQYIAIPIFAILIAIETFAIIKDNRTMCDLKDTSNNIFIGFVSAFFGTLFGVITSLAYLWVSSITPIQMPMNVWWSWILLLFP